MTYSESPFSQLSDELWHVFGAAEGFQRPVHTGCVIIIDAFLVCSPARIVIGSQAVDGCRRDPCRPGHLGPILPRWGRRHVPTMSPLYVPTAPFHRTSGDGCRWRPVSFRRIVSSISRWTGRGGNQGDAL